MAKMRNPSPRHGGSDYTRGPRIITEEPKAEMKKILGEIQDGTFARQWLTENPQGVRTFPCGAPHLWSTRPKRPVRGMTSWLKDALTCGDQQK